MQLKVTMTRSVGRLNFELCVLEVQSEQLSSTASLALLSLILVASKGVS
jgi:hypothetical protein